MEEDEYEKFLDLVEPETEDQDSYEDFVDE